MLILPTRLSYHPTSNHDYLDSVRVMLLFDGLCERLKMGPCLRIVTRVFASNPFHSAVRYCTYHTPHALWLIRLHWDGITLRNDILDSVRSGVVKQSLKVSMILLRLRIVTSIVFSFRRSPHTAYATRRL